MSIKLTQPFQEANHPLQKLFEIELRQERALVDECIRTASSRKLFSSTLKGANYTVAEQLQLDQQNSNNF